MNKILNFLKHPIQKLRNRSNGRFIKTHTSLDDEQFLKAYFKRIFHRELNLDNPQTFGEKLQWLKLYDRNPKYVIQSDKYLVRNFVKETVGEKYLIPLLGVWDNPEEIDFNLLPNEFVLKCNHNSGKGMYICKNKQILNNSDIQTIKSNLQKGLDEDYFLQGREWPYKNIPRKIVAEEYLGNGDGTGIIDYKFFCFNGSPKCLLIATNRAFDVRFDYFDIDLNPLPFEQGGKRGFYKPGIIKNYDEMVSVAKTLSKGIPHVRIDLYNVDGKIYFGEMTFFDSSGFALFKPEKWDYVFGEWLTLPNR